MFFTKRVIDWCFGFMIYNLNLKRRIRHKNIFLHQTHSIPHQVCIVCLWIGPVTRLPSLALRCSGEEHHKLSFSLSIWFYCFQLGLLTLSLPTNSQAFCVLTLKHEKKNPGEGWMFGCMSKASKSTNNEYCDTMFCSLSCGDLIAIARDFQFKHKNILETYCFILGCL